tara:strand:- start:1776 stop:2621 length:846 start_codon:yes stop_codon:yes gene_type:complete
MMMLKKIDETITQYLVDRYGEAVRDDVGLLLGGKFQLHHLFNLRTMIRKDCDLSGGRNMLKVVSDSLSKKDFAGVCLDGCKNARILFVNGVMTPYSLAQWQRDCLQMLFKQPVGLVYNPTESLIADLLECHQDRYGEPTMLAHGLVAQIEYTLKTSPYPVTVVGYSQGAIIATRALSILTARLGRAQLQRVRYITFGAGFRENQLHEAIVQEHFANLRDPVVHLGLLRPGSEHTGVIHTRDAQGHMLVADYLSKGARHGFDLSKSPVFARLIGEDIKDAAG